MRELEIPGGLSCREAAKAAAVMIATWQFQGRAEPPRAPASPVPPPPQPAPPLPASTPPAPTAVATSAPPSPAAPATPEPPRATRAPSPPPSADHAANPRRLGIGGGISVGRAADQFPTSAMVELSFGRVAGGSIRGFASRSSRYSLPVGTGRATWTRSTVGVGGAVTGRQGGWGGQVHLDVLGALLAISGDGFAVNETDSQLAFGMAMGGRALRDLGPADVWLDLTFGTWPGRNRVFLRDSADSRNLSTFEVSLSAGVDFFVWP
jgi:hypothetical protein